MTQEQYNKFEQELIEAGYRKYPSNHRGEYAYYKGYGKSKLEEDRSNYQICFDVYNFGKYPQHTDKENPYSISFTLMISRKIDERVDIINTDIETLSDAESFSEYMYNTYLGYEKIRTKAVE